MAWYHKHMSRREKAYLDSLTDDHVDYLLKSAHEILVESGINYDDYETEIGKHNRIRIRKNARNHGLAPQGENNE